MNQTTTTQCVLFEDLFPRPVHAIFDRPDTSSDGGALLLKAADRKLGLIDRLTAALHDPRQPGKIDHTTREMLAQRLFAIAVGYPDANDAGRLAFDPVHKLLADRDPISGDPLASQPTLSRFENAVTRTELYRLGEALADTVIERHRKRLHGKALWITVDLDVTEDPTHGAQQLSFFNGHYDTWCYLPVLGFLTFDDEPEQYLFTAVLRPGNAPTMRGAIGILRRVLGRLRRAFPRANLLVRLDGGFACPEIFDFLEEDDKVFYVVGMPKNSVLTRKGRRLLGRARRLSRKTRKTERFYGQCRYAARRWPHRRRVVFKAEVIRYPGRDPKDNLRFVVTNLPGDSAQTIYEDIYCQRGEIENRLKELLDGLAIDRTSCSRFWANQFRVLVTAAAYVLMQELRWAAARTALKRAQVATLRDHLLKLGAQVVQSVRRVVLHLPAAFPHLEAWARIAQVLAPRAG